MSESTAVQVVVRLRPFSDKENKGNTLPVVTASTESKQVTVIKGAGNRQQRQTYAVDNVFSSFSTQKEVFQQTIEPVISDVLSGFECTMFAYGQTGTGKTHTMEGSLDDEENRGIIPRSAQAIFERLKDVKNHFTESSVTAQYLEIYNEELADLLTEREAKLQIVEDVPRDGKKSKGLFVQNLSEKVVETAEDVHNLMKLAQERRRIGETKMNKASSRSHCLFTLKVHAKKIVDSTGAVMECMGKLHMVDLAGSECAKTAGQEDPKLERERKNINQSLLTLGRVISALREKNNMRIPYRDSKLTRLLQESLGGRCKTVIIATVSPSVLAVDETISTLNYAQAAHGIQNKPVATSYLKVGEGARPSTAQATNSSGASVQDWNQMECRLTYLQTELDEAQAALSRKHMEQQKIIDRAEAAEQQRDQFESEMKAAKIAVEEQQRKVESLAGRLYESIVECEKRDTIIGVRSETEAKLTVEAKNLLSTLKSSLAEGGRYRDALVAHAQEQSRVRSEGQSVVKAVEGGLRGLTEGVEEACREACSSSDARVAEAEVQGNAAKEGVEAMKGSISSLEASIKDMGQEQSSAAKQLEGDASALLSAEVGSSKEVGVKLTSLVSESVEQANSGFKGAVDAVNAAEDVLGVWADEAKQRIEECAETLKKTHQGLAKQLKGSKEDSNSALAVVFDKLSKHLAALEKIAGEMEAQCASQATNVASLNSISSEGDAAAESHASTLTRLGKSISKALTAQEKGQKDAEVLEALDTEKTAAQARADEQSGAMEAQRGELEQAVKEGTQALAEVAVCGVVSGAETALSEGSNQVKDMLVSQAEGLATAGKMQLKENAEESVRKMLADAGSSLKAQVGEVTGVLGTQSQGLAATSARLVGQKEDEEAVVGTADEGHAALVAKIAEQEAMLASQAALLEEQRAQLDSFLSQQKEAQQLLLKNVMGTLESVLSKEVAALGASAAEGVATCTATSNAATELNASARQAASKLSEDAAASRATLGQKVAAWGESRDSAIKEVSDHSAQNADVQARLTAILSEQAERESEVDAATAAWGDANRSVGKIIDETHATNASAASALLGFSKTVAGECASARAQMAAWGEAQRASYAAIDKVVADNAQLATDMASGAKLGAKAIAKVEKLATSWGDADRKCSAAISKVAEEAGTLAQDIAEARSTGRAAEEGLAAAMEGVAAMEGASKERVNDQIAAGGDAFGELGSAKELIERSWASADVAVTVACDGLQSSLATEASSVVEMKGTRPAVIASLGESAGSIASGLAKAAEHVSAMAEAQEGFWAEFAAAEATRLSNYASSVTEAHNMLASKASASLTVSDNAMSSTLEGISGAVDACKACKDDVSSVMSKAKAEAAAAAEDAAAAVRSFATEYVKCDEAVGGVPEREALVFSEDMSATPAHDEILHNFKPTSKPVDVDAPCTNAAVAPAPAGEFEEGSEAQLETASNGMDAPVQEEVKVEEIKEAEHVKEPAVQAEEKAVIDAENVPALAPKKTPGKKTPGKSKVPPRSKMTAPKTRPGTLKTVN